MTDKGCAVDGYEAERRPVRAPLVVVEKAPVKVAEHGDTLVNRRPHGAKSFSGVPDPQLIVIGRDAVSVTSRGTPLATCQARRRPMPNASGRMGHPVSVVGSPSGTGSGPSGPMTRLVYACTPRKSSEAAGSRN